MLFFAGHSTAVCVTLMKWEWFEEWENERVKKRGSTYEQLKDAITERIWNQVLSMYPHLKDKVS